MKRICFIVDSIFTIGGVQRVTAVIAKALACEYDVTIVTFDSEDQKNLSMYGLNESNIQFRYVSYPNIGKIKQFLCKTYSGLYIKMRLHGERWSNLYARSSFPHELRKKMVTELQSGNYDVIIGVHAPLASRLATLKKYLGETKIYGWIHNSFEALFDKNSLYIGEERKRHYIYQFKKLDKTILLCKHDIETYKQYDPTFCPTYIYNPLTLIPITRSNGTTKTFLAIGRFSHLHKGFDILIKAFAQFAKINKEWNLEIVGEGVEEELYRFLINNYGLEKRVHIHPFTNNVQLYYSNAQIYVLSSRWEGFGLVLVEAMAHGLPTISSDLPTSKEILGEFGIYFKNGDIQELAQCLEKSTRIDWQEKSRQAIVIAQKYDIKNIITQWKALIENEN